MSEPAMDEAVERVARAIALSTGMRSIERDWTAQLLSAEEKARVVERRVQLYWRQYEAEARAALRAAIPIIGEEMAREVEARPFHSDYPYDVETCTRTAQAIRSHAQHLVGKVGEGA